jgi:ABC-type Fe3+ transport system substrate-binding protein
MKRTALSLALLLFVFGRLFADDAKKVIVYAALDEKTANELAATFQKETGYPAEIALQIEQAGTVAGRIKTEAPNARADVVIGGNSNFHADLAAGGYLDRYTSPVVKSAGIDQKFMDPDGYWTGWYLGALCILYNEKRYNEEIKPKGIQPPATWDDLLNPAYKGQVIASNPATTGGAYLMVAAQVFRLGSEKAGFDYVRKLHANVAQYTKGQTAPSRSSARGRPSSGSPGDMTRSNRRRREISPSWSCFRATPDSRSVPLPSSRMLLIPRPPGSS